jgi:hypothetical protein
MIYPLLGIDEQGKLVMLIAPVKLNPISVMHLRGNPPPASVMALIDGDESEAINALRDMTKYYRTYYSKKTRK